MLVPSLREVFDRASGADTRRVDAQESIYASGEADEFFYLIESGQVKVSMASAGGKDCLIAVYRTGDLFGESCFTGAPKRFETATAMQPTVVRRVSRRDFLAEVEKTRTAESMLQHLATRVMERQWAVFDHVTLASERRLAKILLDVAERLGVPEGPYLRLDQKISHEELSQMVGTTRPRITAFIGKFRKLGIIETFGRAISVHRQRTREYIESD